MTFLALQKAYTTCAPLAARPANRPCRARRLPRVVAQAAPPETDAGAPSGCGTRRSKAGANWVCAAATAGAIDAELVDENIAEYCSLDPNGRRPVKELSLAEKEELFLEAMMAFYYNQRPFLSNEEFDNLKDELMWEGSKLVVLSKDEKLFMEAQLAYNKGLEPIMSDAEYDALKERLKGSSVFAPVEGPSCSIGSGPGKFGLEFSEVEVDYLKMAALSLVPTFAVTAVLFGVDALTGGALVKLPGSVGLVVWSGLLLPSVYVVSAAIKNFMFKDSLILKGKCPNCGEPNSTYFGDILTVPGSRDTNTVTCPCCQSKLTFDADKRMVIVSEAAPKAA